MRVLPAICSASRPSDFGFFVSLPIANQRPAGLARVLRRKIAPYWGDGIARCNLASGAASG